MFIPIPAKRIKSDRFFCNKKKSVYDENIEDDCILLYAALEINWLKNTFSIPDDTDSEKVVISSEIVTDERYNNPFCSVVFEQFFSNDDVRSHRKILRFDNLSPYGKKFVRNFYEKSGNITAKHFFSINKRIKEEMLKPSQYYLYQDNSEAESNKDLIDALEKDKFMQFLLYSNDGELPVTNYTLQELGEDPFIRYIANHVNELYLSIRPNYYATNSDICIKKLIWK